MGLFWRKLYGGSVVTREHREEILSFLTKTAYEDRIPAGVPEGTRVAHKIGNETGVFSDAGIVFADKPFVLVILSKKALEREAKIALPEITKAVWEFETSP
ncbi:MAG: serine hydrolase, partial [bacterium]|nr:serine hydrolase [bacterium]